MREIIAATKRLVLKETTKDDSEIYSELLMETLAHPHMSNRKTTTNYKEIAERIIEEKNMCRASIFHKNSGDFIGLVCMENLNNHLPELGIELLEKFRNQGYGPEAVVAFVNWFNDKYGITEIKLCVEKTNLHCLHVLEKVNCKFIGMSSALNNDDVEKYASLFPDTDCSYWLQDNVMEFVLQLPIKL